MTDTSQPIDLAGESVSKVARSPLKQSLYQYRRNKMAIIGTLVVVGFFFMAVTAALWTNAGVLDSPRGYRARHTINPAGWDRVDAYPDPGQCARDNLEQGQAWCSVVDAETRTRFPNLCSSQLPNIGGSQWCYVLGGDGSGKDILTQTVYGSQVSLAVAILGAFVSLTIGTIYGVVSGYYGGWIDNTMMRIIDFLFGIPGLVIIILMQVFFRGITRDYEGDSGLLAYLIELNKAMGGLLFLFIAIGMFSWIGLARLARGQVLAYREKEFVEAARAVGATDRRIIFRHLLPNIVGPLVVVTTLSVPGFIFLEAFLSFIGLGVQPGVPSWGAMISNIQTVGGLNSNQHLVIVPSVALVLLTLAFNFVGDALNDVLNPRMRNN